MSPSQRRHLVVSIVMLTLLTGPVGPSWAQETLRPDEEPEANGGLITVLAASVGGGRYAEDGVGVLEPSLTLALPEARIADEGRAFGRPVEGRFLVELSAPLYFTVVDRAPDDGGAFRSTEWDEPSEFLSILSRIVYADAGDPVFLRAGELANVRIGHGTIVDRFANDLEFDRARWGMHLAINALRAGGEFFADDLIDPWLAGVRGYWTPWVFADTGLVLRSLSFGVSFIGDPAQPRTLESDVDGNLRLDAERHLVPDEERETAMLGFDIETQFVNTERTRLTLYADANIHFGRGTGLHSGMSFGQQIGERTVLNLRGEYRFAGEGYLPGYFSRLYPVSRLQAQAPGSREPLWGFADEITGGRRHGYLAELGINHARAGIYNLTIIGGGGAFDEALSLRVASPEGQRVRVGLAYELPFFDSWSEFRPFERALLQSEVQVQITDWLLVWGRAGRYWRALSEESFLPTNDFRAGATFFYAFD